VATGDLPPGLTQEDNVDIGDGGLWTRRVGMTLIAVFGALGLLNVFGQAPSEIRVQAAKADLKVHAPTDLRGGLLWQARVEVRAHTDLEQPKLVLSPGWLEQMTLNSTEPQPMSEATRDGRIVLTYDKLSANEKLTVWLQYQANPVNLGQQDMDVELDDLSRPVARVNRTVMVWP
jgi:hypothetical protein